MPQFKDNTGREWTLSLDGPTIREIRRDFDGLDLIDPKGETYLRLGDDPILTIDVLWTLCREQAQRVPITDVQFGRNLAGDGILEAATEALLKAILDFFPRHKRVAILAAWTKKQQIETEGMARVTARINDPALMESAIKAIEDQFDAHLKSLLTASPPATTSQDSSASPPAASPGGS